MNARTSLGLVAVGLLVAACSSASDANDGAASSSSAVSAASASLRHDLDRILEITDHRLLGNAELKAYLHSANADVLEAACVAAGRIGDPSLQGDVVALLGSTSMRVRASAAFALGLLGGSANEAPLAAQLAKETDEDTRTAMLLALGRVGTAASIPTTTAPLLATESRAIHAAAAEAYADLVRNGVAPSTDANVAARLLAFAKDADDERAVASAFALLALASHDVKLDETALTQALHAAPSATARAYLVRTIATFGTPTAVATLADVIANDANARVRAEACTAMPGSTPAALSALVSALHDASNAVVVAAATQIGALGAAASSVSGVVQAAFDASGSAWVRATALTALVAIDPASAAPFVQKGLADAWPVELAAIAGLGALGTTSTVEQLVTYAGGKDHRAASAAIEAIAALPASALTPDVKPALKAAIQTKDWEVVASVCDASAAFGWTDLKADLRAAYDWFPTQAAMNGRLEIVYALGAIGSASDPADLALLQRGIADDEVLVETYAAQSYQQLTGKDVSSQVRADSVVHGQTPSHAEVAAAERSFVALETTRGTIVLRMLPEAPLSATNFVGLVASGFYDGLPFHRVVPNFVAQGGDPRGDGSGGSSHLVREEISRVPHLRGTVGMATEGKDTGSSQIFFNEGWNVSLDNRYTVFAEVVSGMDAAERLEVGDVIVRASVL
jgi:peptidylprolyl isomerase